MVIFLKFKDFCPDFGNVTQIQYNTDTIIDFFKPYNFYLK